MVTLKLHFMLTPLKKQIKEYQNTIQKGTKKLLEPTSEPWEQRTCYIANPKENIIEIGS